jgi:hypothetical protein
MTSLNLTYNEVMALAVDRRNALLQYLRDTREKEARAMKPKS